MLAVIKTGGKQYIVSPGHKIKIDLCYQKIGGRKRKIIEEGQEIIFDEVLLVEKGKKVEIGNPSVKGVKVVGKVIRHRKGKKIIVFKYKPKTRYKKKTGHRQSYTEVEIKSIDSE